MEHDNKKWTVRQCENGNDDCWCRCIFTEDGHEVISQGSIDKEFAEYVVDLHNNKKKYDSISE